MTLQDQMEAFSIAYLRAVAAVAGYAVSVPDPDDDSVDYTVSAAASSGLLTRPKLDIQLKATSGARIRNGNLAFALKRKNYEDLIADTLVPRILVVVLIPADPQAWMDCRSRTTVLQARALWRSLQGMAPNSNQVSTTVHLPDTQRFTQAALSRILGQVHRREPL